MIYSPPTLMSFTVSKNKQPVLLNSRQLERYWLLGWDTVPLVNIYQYVEVCAASVFWVFYKSTWFHIV